MKLESILQAINALRLAEQIDYDDFSEAFAKLRTAATLARVELEVGLAGVQIEVEK